MSDYTDNLEYSLAKRVPDMARGFTIATNYGNIMIEADHAPKIMKAVRIALERELDEAKVVSAGIRHPKPGVVVHRMER